MKQYVLPGIVLILILLITGGILKQTVFRKANAGLQINSIPQSVVYLDGKDVGKTPYEEEKLSPGEKTIKLIPESTTGTLSPWEAKIKLINGTVALVNREFGETENDSAGEAISLESMADKKSASLLIISQPDSAVIKFDGEAKGFTPLTLDKIQKGDHQISVSAPDYKERIVKTKFYNGFKTVINVKLAQQVKEGEITPTPLATPTGQAKGVTPTLTPKAKVTSIELPKPYVKILDTPTGWLRVRMEPSTSATESAKIYPGETYPLLEEKSGWYKISFDKDKEGWISGKYAQKFE